MDSTKHSQLRFYSLHVCTVFALCAGPLPALAAEPATVEPVVECRSQDLLGYTPEYTEVKEHRRFEVSPIRYAFGKSLSVWGLALTLGVDESGRVRCYDLKGTFGDQQFLNDEQRAAIESLSTWRYLPFERNGAPQAAIVREIIKEEEQPERYLPVPIVPLDQVSISLKRTGCFGSCPSYEVKLNGDGRATFIGEGFVAVLGRHSYRVPASDVARLVESVRAKDIWSLRGEYRGPVTDNPTYILTLQMGQEVHSILDYVGTTAGMPAGVSEFEDEVDKAAHSLKWIELSGESMDVLQAERFDFHSQAAGEMLVRAVANESGHDELAMARLIQLGAPVDRKPTSQHGFEHYGPILEEALLQRRASLIDPLIKKGTLQTDGILDRKKLDSAFLAAIAGGDLLSVQAIWNADDGAHPSLAFDSVTDDSPPLHKKVPVTLALVHERYRQYPWDGLSIAQWLAAKGCDLKAHRADGATLLHIAAAADDVPMVKFLLSQGLGASRPGRYGLPALGSAQNEDVAMILLNAGTDFSMMDDKAGQFRKYAQGNHWARVVGWLDTHGM